MKTRQAQHFQKEYDQGFIPTVQAERLTWAGCRQVDCLQTLDYQNLLTPERSHVTVHVEDTHEKFELRIKQAMLPFVI